MPSLNNLLTCLVWRRFPVLALFTLTLARIEFILRAADVDFKPSDTRRFCAHLWEWVLLLHQLWFWWCAKRWNALKSLRNTLIFQVILIALGIAASFFTTLQAIAVAYGGSVSILNTLLQLWHNRRAEKLAGADAAYNMRILYRCAIERIVLSIAFLVLGLVTFKLHPLSILCGFILGHISVLITGFRKQS